MGPFHPILTAAVVSSGDRWQAALTTICRRSSMCQPEARVSSNVGQNYPYTSETEAERAVAIGQLTAERDGLADRIAAEATPLDENDRWWVWKCPTPGCPGLLHAAGYSRENRGLFVVCDGSCAKTFRR
jgi:hypothetical protein